MNEWLKKMIGKFKDFWKNSSIVKKVILVGVVAVIAVVIIVTAKVSARPDTVRLYDTPVTDESMRSQIVVRLNQENVQAEVDSAGYISIGKNENKDRLLSILLSEGLQPASWDPYEQFYHRSWSDTDQEQNVKLKNAATAKVAQSLEALDGIQKAWVTINIPEVRLFRSDQNPVSASIILRLSSSSDLESNVRRQKSVERLVLTMIEGLKSENLTITDTEGKTLNDFEGLAESDRLSSIQKQQKIRHEEEAKLKAYIVNMFEGLQVGAGEGNKPSRKQIGDVVVNLEMDMSEKNQESTIYTPIQRKADNPNTPYDDSDYVDTLPISQQTVTKKWEGTGYNPEGSSGVEGQTPPVYSDMSNVIGSSTETGVTQNNVINTTHTKEIVSPQIGRRSVSVNVSGVLSFVRDPKTFKYVFDEETGLLKTKYTPVPAEDLQKYTRLIEGAINFDANRGDKVFVTDIPIDYSEWIEAESAKEISKMQRNRTLLLALGAVAAVLVGFIIVRIISKEMERRRRLREEELLRQQQAEREKALWEARDDANMQVTMSVEESRRAELQENAINMAKEHPEDVALLIRTWLMEE